MEPKIATIFNRIREAQIAQQSNVTVPLSQINLSIATLMKESGVILNFQEDEANKHLNIFLNSENKRIKEFINQLWQDQPPKEPELIELLQDLENEDPAVRIKAVIGLGELYYDN
ncbi:MAG: 30S ribosomal protein S8 [Microcoleus sp. PH2017_40_RAT_O_B]|uniref:30S ribosomal protein S8 n=1 Tax=unclassified Microcoleus TaxID=2642155 RepID=UPI001DFFEF36|nr:MULTISPECIES: 30S ribosomal protein S8 [unclassified Microcoleus]TAE16837.1 MAG: 30S ribosomal protein S8 [Oscillatoriales cyanobacterium]MCC3572088.1 30S ribosomal protein S8 [Microcoleus sp. PH2017_34_RAT_O_A]MCC3584726.1 30S ribosomal protein S8 [Microcoleus sp. PH2017_30_WIL_O_A]MCC3610111.1 30S ribosomal protein S8 [Microcoleus sp. PH2017_40_RAT_O_B]TAE28435.1 MAG: 30S ribosomal protein S8 [Oscillatoriales cyanobacterium]